MSRIAMIVTVALLAGLARGQGEEPKGIDWQPDFEGALEAARTEARPIMIAFVLRGEPANEEICGEHFRDEEIIALSRKFVCLLAYATYASPDVRADTANSDAMVAALQGRVSAKQLARVEMEARSAYMASGPVSAPQFLFVKPDGESILLRHVWMLDRRALLLKMHKALHYLDPAHELPPALRENLKTESDLVAALLSQSDGDNMQSRREAMEQLADHDDPRVVEFLIAQTDDEVDQAKRLEAIGAMGREGGAKFLARLHELLLKERSHQVRTNVADALRRIGMVESVAPLLDVLKKEKKSQVRSLLLRALVACGGPREEVLDYLERTLLRGDDLDRITILAELTAMSWQDRFEKGLLKCLKSSDSQVRVAACWLAGAARVEAARRPLQMRFSSEKNAARRACAWALAELGETPAEAGEDPGAEVRAALPSASY